MQVDDDAYVRVERLLKKLEVAPQKQMFMGSIEDPGGGPNREVGHQWYVSEDDWPSDTYPPWAHGVGYVLTQDLVQEIAAGELLPPVPSIFPLAASLTHVVNVIVVSSNRSDSMQPLHIDIRHLLISTCVTHIP